MASRWQALIRLAITTDDQKLQAGILLAIQHVGDWRPFFEAWGVAWRESRVEMFATSGASTSTPWPMYSRATREAQYAAAKSSMLGRVVTRRDLLRWMPGRRERLMPSLTDRRHPDNIEEVASDRAAYGTRVPYAANHQYGRGTAPEWAGGHSVPRRPLLALGAAMEMRTQQIADAFAAQGVHAIDDTDRHRSGLSTSQVRDILTAVAGGAR